MVARATSALSNILRPAPRGYICPLCLRVILPLVELSYEHVPPKSLGGSRLCLTCRECNSKAGHSIDAAMHREQMLGRLLSLDGHKVRIKLGIDGSELNATIARTTQSIDIQVTPKRNNPTVEEKVRARLTTSQLPLPAFNITAPGGYRKIDAENGYLKSAYLAAFSKFGYRWILDPEVAPIRDQIQGLRRMDYINYRIGIKNDGRAPPSGFYFMESPLSLVMARIGDYGVFLPWPGGAPIKEISTWIEDEKSRGPSAKHSYIKFAPWPRGLELTLDWR